MEEKKYKLVIDGNSFYEVDLECQRKKKEAQAKKKSMLRNSISKAQRK